MRPQATTQMHPSGLASPFPLWATFSGSRSPGTQDYETKPKNPRRLPPGIPGGRRSRPGAPGVPARVGGLAVPELARRRVEGASTAVPWRGARARRRSYPVPRAKARPGVQVPARLLTVPELGGPGEGLPLPFFGHRGGVEGDDEGGRNCLLDASLPSVEDANGGSA